MAVRASGTGRPAQQAGRSTRSVGGPRRGVPAIGTSAANAASTPNTSGEGRPTMANAMPGHSRSGRRRVVPAVVFVLIAVPV